MIIAFPHKPGKGGPGSFQIRFEKYLKEHGWLVTYPEDKIRPDVVMVVGGTKKLWWLAKMKFKGIPVVHRLAGLNWLHKLKKFSPKKYFYAEGSNLILKIIRSFFATHIVYQSEFVKEWWKKKGWFTGATSTIIYNGVDLDIFTPSKRDDTKISLLCVEGNLDYTPYAIDLLNYLQDELIEKSNYESLIVYGGFENPVNQSKLNPKIKYMGKVSSREIHKVYKDAVYLSLDINAACPNTVIEALASGIPVIGYDTGALKELVGDAAGKIVDYSENHWQLSSHDFKYISLAAKEVLQEKNNYSFEARERAKAIYDLKLVFKQYEELILMGTK